VAYGCTAVRIGGIQPPLDEWKKILDDMNSKARKLEEEYEVTCTMRKVVASFYIIKFMGACSRGKGPALATLPRWLGWVIFYNYELICTLSAGENARLTCVRCLCKRKGDN